jgi:hypothetical protein
MQRDLERGLSAPFSKSIVKTAIENVIHDQMQAAAANPPTVVQIAIASPSENGRATVPHVMPIVVKKAKTPSVNSVSSASLSTAKNFANTVRYACRAPSCSPKRIRQARTQGTSQQMVAARQ